MVQNGYSATLTPTPETILPLDSNGQYPVSVIPDSSITTEKIENGSITNEKLNLSYTFITPTLLNSWRNYGDGYHTAQYFKDAFGVVHLFGLITGGTASHMFTLPVGYRPLSQLIFTVMRDYNTIARVDIYSSGNILLVPHSSSWVTLSGISFLAGQ